MIEVSTDEFRVMLADPDPDIRWKARMLFLLPVADYLHGAAGDEIIRMLANRGTDPVGWERAYDIRHSQLQGGPISHVVAVLKVLADDSAADAWPDCAELLSTVVSSTEFDFMVTVLAMTESEGLGNRLATALGLPGGRDLPRFTTGQTGDDASVTCQPCTPDATGPNGGDDASHAVSTARCARVSALAALLGSRLDQVRQCAVRELAKLGPGVAGVLRTVRRSRPPARRDALTALAEIGWHELARPTATC